MLGNLKGYELLILVLVIVLLFGARRLPDAARGLGRSLRIFKAETKGLHDDDPAPAPEPKAVDTATPVDRAAEQPAATEPSKPTQT